MESFWFWIWKPLAEAAVWLLVALLMGAGYALMCLPSIVRQWRCKHPTVRENRSCNAICRSCGKNLGFIGAWLERRKD